MRFLLISGTRETVSSPTWLRTDCSRANMAQRTALMTWSLPLPLLGGGDDTFSLSRRVLAAPWWKVI